MKDEIGYIVVVIFLISIGVLILRYKQMQAKLAITNE